MQTPSGKLLHLDPETACEKTLCVFEGRGLLPSNQDLQPANEGFSGKLQLDEATISRKSSLLKRFRSSAGKLKSSSPEIRKVSFRDEPSFETVISPSCDHPKAQFLFPDFFPRGKAFCQHQDCLIPLNVRADPVLVSWLHLFGLQMTK